MQNFDANLQFHQQQVFFGLLPEVDDLDGHLRGLVHAFAREVNGAAGAAAELHIADVLVSRVTRAAKISNLGRDGSASNHDLQFFIVSVA